MDWCLSTAGPGVFWYLSYTLETTLRGTANLLAVSHMDAPSWRCWNTCATWMRCRYYLRLKQNKRKVSQRWSVNSHCLLVAFLAHLLPLLHQTRWNGSTKVYSSQLNIPTLNWHECSLYTLCLLFFEISNVFISILITSLHKSWLKLFHDFPWSALQLQCAPEGPSLYAASEGSTLSLMPISILKWLLTESAPLLTFIFIMEQGRQRGEGWGEDSVLSVFFFPMSPPCGSHLWSDVQTEAVQGGTSQSHWGKKERRREDIISKS